MRPISETIIAIAPGLAVVVVAIGVGMLCNWLVQQPTYIPEDFSSMSYWQEFKFIYQPVLIGKYWLPIVTFVSCVMFLVKIHEIKIKSAITSWLEK